MSELHEIMTVFADSGWELIAEPAKAFLAGEYDRGALIASIRQADAECGSCGCSLDAMYKRALELL